MDQLSGNMFGSTENDDYQKEEKINHSQWMSRHPKLRNTDKSLYLRSEKAKRCPLCHRYYKRHIVAHFKSYHKDSEVFPARISPPMAELVKNNQRSYIKDENWKKSQLHLQTLCLFCEEEKNFSVNNLFILIIILQFPLLKIM